MPRRQRPQGVILAGAGITLPAPEPAARRRPVTPPQPAVGTGSRPTRVLGLDLSINVTGWCLLVGGCPTDHGTFELPDYRRKGESLAGLLGRRAAELGEQVGVLVTTHRPELVGYEYPDVARPHWSGGSKGREFSAVQGLSRAEGFLVALWPQIGRGARLVAVPMTHAKRAITGRIDANKDQIAYALRFGLGWDVKGWTPDETDAGAVAVAAREMGL